MHLIFDLDGTPVDSYEGLRYALEKTVQQVFPSRPVEQLEFQIGPPVREIMLGALGSLSEVELGQLERTFRSIYDSEGWKKSKAYRGVRSTLRTLQKQSHWLYLATNKPKLPTGQMLSRLRLAAFFREIACTDSQSTQYRDKTASLRYLIETYTMAPEQAIYVGDSLSDQQAAAAAGIGFIGVEYGYGDPTGGSVEGLTIRNIQDLPAMVSVQFNQKDSTCHV
jgi:phosphoglycolate phosphatase